MHDAAPLLGCGVDVAHIHPRYKWSTQSSRGELATTQPLLITLALCQPAAPYRVQHERPHALDFAADLTTAFRGTPGSFLPRTPQKPCPAFLPSMVVPVLAVKVVR